MSIDFDMIIDADPDLLPFRINVSFNWQPLEGRPLDLIEQ